MDQAPGKRAIGLSFASATGRGARWGNEPGWWPLDYDDYQEPIGEQAF